MTEKMSLPTLWRQRASDEKATSSLVEELGLSQVLARAMVARQIATVDHGRTFLAPSLTDLPDPEGLAGMGAAVERLADAVFRGETIGVFGDYDVDGVTSSTFLSEFLELSGARAVVTIPDRLVEGYGLNQAGVDRLESAGASVIVTVDCGVTNHEEVAYANRQGLDVVIIDHHTVPSEVPEAVALINPHRPDCERHAEHLCAVGVTFNLCAGLRRMLRERGWYTSRQEPDLRKGLDLVALGTVADVVPLIADNRILVTAGLKVMSKQMRPGFRALMEVADLQPHRLSAGSLAFQLGPRVNAAGRLGDALSAVELFRTQDLGAARTLATQLDRENKARRDLEVKITLEAIEQIEDSKEHQRAHVLVVGADEWHPGVVGIVASRLVERFGKPAVVIGEGGRGSGRSISSFHLYNALAAIPESMNGFGGHAHAAGVHIDMKRLSSFADALRGHAQKTLERTDLGRRFDYDDRLVMDDVDTDLIHHLGQIAPCGRGNPEPVYRFDNVRLSGLKELRGGHLKGRARHRRPIDILAFGAADKYDLFQENVDLLAIPEINVWRGTQTIQLRVRDVAPTGVRA